MAELIGIIGPAVGEICFAVGTAVVVLAAMLLVIIGARA